MLKGYYWDNVTYWKFWLSKFKKFVSRSVFGEFQLILISLNFKTSCCNLKTRGLGAKPCVALLIIFYFKKNYDFLKSKSPFSIPFWVFLKKTKRNLKWKFPKHSFRACASARIRIKSKPMRSWSSWKTKKGIFCNVYFVRRNFFNIYVLSQCIVYWINFQNTYTFTYQKTVFYTLLLFAFKIVKYLQCILKQTWS